MTAGDTRLLTALRRVAAKLDALGHPWALVGGLAVSVRAEPRFTRDLDLAVAVADDAAAEALTASLVAAGFRLQVSLEQEALGRLAAVRLLAPNEVVDGIVVDLLFASTGIEPEICGAATPIEVVPGLTVPVAQSGHLVAMKLLSASPDRPQDAIDLQALRPTLDVDDRARAIAAVTLIERAGAHRGRALRADLEHYLRD